MDDITNDPYVYGNTSILRNLLNIQELKALEIAEAEISSANIMLVNGIQQHEKLQGVCYKF